jgi:zinc/manganese transport system ATP-binding protein
MSMRWPEFNRTTRINPNHLTAVDLRRLTTGKRMAHHAIELHQVTCGYGASPVLKDVTLRVPPGQFVCMIGPSGAGKTTLLRAMLGLTPWVRGEVVVDGRLVRPGTAPAGVGYVPQVETVDWHFPVTVENVVLMGKVGTRRLLPWASKQDRRDVAGTLERLGIGELGSRHIRDLSGGQQQRTFLARALIGKPQLLFLDEPTASVDIKTRDDILHLLVDVNRDDITIVMTTHELNTVAAHLPWVVCINGGVVAQGVPEKIFTGPILSRTFNTEMRVVRDDHSGSLLVAEAGSHGPFSGLKQVAANDPALIASANGTRASF